MKIRGLNRKGQEVVSNFGIVGIIGIVFLVVVILGIWYFSTRGEQAAGSIPENAEIIAQACSVVATESSINSYCLQIREVKSGVYATCDKMSNYNIVVTDSDGTNVQINSMNEKCKQYATQLESKIREACVSGDYKGKPNIEINSKKCSAYLTGTCQAKSNIKACTELSSTTCNSQSNCEWIADTANSSKGKCQQKSNLAVCTTITDLYQCNSRSDCEVKYTN